MSKPKALGRLVNDLLIGVRSERLMIRVAPSERKEWEKAARADGRPLGQWIRRMVEKGRVRR